MRSIEFNRQYAGGRRTFVDEDFKRASLAGSVMAGCDFRGSNMMGANLHSTRLSDADFSWVNLRSADLSFASAGDWPPSFRGALLLYTSFRFADLDCADFRGAVVVGADFTGASLVGADFTGAVTAYPGSVSGESPKFRADMVRRIVGFNTTDLAGMLRWRVGSIGQWADEIQGGWRRWAERSTAHGGWTYEQVALAGGRIDDPEYLPHKLEDPGEIYGRVERLRTPDEPYPLGDELRSKLGIIRDRIRDERADRFWASFTVGERRSLEYRKLLIQLGELTEWEV